ncbi:MAG TPA: glycosyltransferase family 4 protein [Terriglobales bacterium]
MKIAFIGGFAFSPKGTMRARAHPLAVELVRLGHQVTIFLPPYDNIGDCGKKWEAEGVRITNVGHPDYGHGLSRRVFRYPRMLWQLISEVKRYSPDLIHVFKPKGFSGAAGTYFLLGGRPPVVLDCDDWEGWGGWNDIKTYPWTVKEYIDRQERWMIRRASAVTVASRSLEKRAIALRGIKGGVYYVPNCGPSATNHALQDRIAGLGREEIRRELGWNDAPAILFSGHIEDKASLEFFARAAGPICQKLAATVAFVGYEPESARIQSLFEAYTDVKRVILPRLDYEHFLKVVRACDVAAFPYKDDAVHRAKCSARIVDYMAIGRPVLTSAVGQNCEYIADGESGVLAVPGDETDFAHKLERLLVDPEWAARLGENARKRVRQNFNWSGEALQQCLQAYDRALAVRPVSGRFVRDPTPSAIRSRAKS